MQVILSILLYLQVILSPGTYTASEIDTVAGHHECEIREIEGDPERLNRIIEIYKDEVEGITIIDDGQLK